ncbi:hypothetical protein H5410_011472 [Solanum commersonii]|uniref:Uncharacterized protein n=1 Tax=Solanum commersonii TaxID=4109 RepID=A0A9J6ANS6_SOLCO|nr:hypothetical protein H5410_011472 [Solanum commersonii]
MNVGSIRVHQYQYHRLNNKKMSQAKTMVHRLLRWFIDSFVNEIIYILQRGHKRRRRNFHRRKH